MGLKKKGILQLADDLVAHKKMYDQEQFGKADACGTFACMAGMCLWRKIGPRKFNALAKQWHYASNGAEECKEAGYAQLGLGKPLYIFVDIFSDINYWPDDLADEYRSNGPQWRVIAALKALQRLLPDGSIDLDPTAVHTRIPQLKELLAAEKAKKKPKVRA